LAIDQSYESLADFYQLRGETWNTTVFAITSVASSSWLSHSADKMRGALSCTPSQPHQSAYAAYAFEYQHPRGAECLSGQPADGRKSTLDASVFRIRQLPSFSRLGPRRSRADSNRRTLPVAHAILTAARNANLTIVEDDSFGDLPMAMTNRLATLDQLNNVISVGTFSKTLSASLRSGFVAARGTTISALAELKMLTTVNSSGHIERLLHRLLTDGH